MFVGEYIISPTEDNHLVPLIWKPGFEKEIVGSSIVIHVRHYFRLGARYSSSQLLLLFLQGNWLATTEKFLAQKKITLSTNPKLEINIISTFHGRDAYHRLDKGKQKTENFFCDFCRKSLILVCLSICFFYCYVF